MPKSKGVALRVCGWNDNKLLDITTKNSEK